ncbi:MAG: 7-cyano-7-deazaguanine synthase QueC [Rickettsia endosymbiont of Culicoides impunctatus]|uniref:7-cyano-7-deazaguanine synthase QueC n=1 Tax=unclassified Candidatus Tisiphia TaxID=2996318 RepID=UPI001E709275|nr:MAG: 7-cyano-7-deazaguanine synthase QueC [Rickettsia endosymbiont of Culicoides impunctatus]
MKKAVALVSGGVDSATVLAMIKKMNYEIYAISFNYSQRNNVELEKVKQLVQNYNVKQHKIINIDLRNFGGSALTDNAIDVPKYKDHSELPDNIPVTYVPARNTIFLSYALGFSEIIGAFDIFIGIHATDSANYPDCRPEYLVAFNNLANLATAVGVSGKQITIHAPLINMSKGEIIKAGLELGVDYSKTISCYDPSDEGLSCGTCHSCLTRLKAFEENNVTDPTNYKK